ncbi:MAG: DJ-1/PfpI family protein [Mogibacterium sp.]|nr:DJ-1/PfpI family protein [Mogibacterium sp.]MBR2541182.1 DJ-1/PfpI family protein [Mogibacterium sp.]
MSKAVVFMADGMEMCECLIVVDLLRRAKVEVITASVMGRNEVTSSHNVRICADQLAEDVDFTDVDMIILPGGRVGTENLAASKVVIDTVKEFADFDKTKRVAAICAAPSILASLGILDGKRATCHPDFEDKMGKAIVRGDKIVVNGDLIMGKALGATFDFALRLVNILAGKETEHNIRKAICYDMIEALDYNWN